jgi:hypothetical protein
VFCRECEEKKSRFRIVSNKTIEQKETSVEYSTAMQVSALSKLSVLEFVREFIVYFQSHNNTIENEAHAFDVCTSVSCSKPVISYKYNLSYFLTSVRKLLTPVYVDLKGLSLSNYKLQACHVTRLVENISLLD